MWEKLLARLSEPSSWAGAAAVAYGVGEIGKINEAPAIAEAIGAAGQSVASGGGWAGAAAALVFGVAAAFMPERGRRS